MAQKQELHQLYSAPKYQKHNVRATLHNQYRREIGIDLADLQSYNYRGYNWILVAVDMFTKKIWGVAMKNKEETTTLRALRVILRKMRVLPRKIRSDQGKEFKNRIIRRYLQSQNIVHIFSLPRNPQSNGQAEKSVGITKKLIFKYMNFSGNNDWPAKLQTLLARYNKTYHTAHKFTPDEVEQFSSQNNVRKLNEVIANLDKTFLKQNKDFDLSQLRPGTQVRVQLNPKQNSLTKSKFMQNYSKDVYTIDKIYVPRQSNLLAVQYRLKDQQNRIIPKRYYNHQLLKIEGTPQNRVSREALYNISNLLKPVVQDNKPYYLVSWIGFQGQYTLEPRSQLIQDVPRLVQMFERRNGVVWVTTSGRRIQTTGNFRNRVARVLIRNRARRALF